MFPPRSVVFGFLLFSHVFALPHTQNEIKATSLVERSDAIPNGHLEPAEINGNGYDAEWGWAGYRIAANWGASIPHGILTIAEGQLEQQLNRWVASHGGPHEFAARDIILDYLYQEPGSLQQTHFRFTMRALRPAFWVVNTVLRDVVLAIIQQPLVGLGNVRDTLPADFTVYQAFEGAMAAYWTGTFRQIQGGSGHRGLLESPGGRNATANATGAVYSLQSSNGQVVGTVPLNKTVSYNDGGIATS